MSTLQFLANAIRSPLQTGALVPSSRWLARSMVDAAGIRAGDVILELGPGTGAFTAELVARHPGHQIVAVERSLPLARVLQQRFSNVRVVPGSVEDLTRLLGQVGIRQVDRVVSGLPWALWSPEFQERLMGEVVGCLSHGGRFVTFHYLQSVAFGRTRTTRRLLCRHFPEVRFTRPVWFNLPPAVVHVADGVRHRRGSPALDRGLGSTVAQPG